MKLSTQQHRIKNEIIENLLTRNTCCLTGAAGTGKTTTLKNIVADLSGKQIILASPTHTACKIMKSATGKNVITVASLLKKIKEHDDETGEVIFYPTEFVEKKDNVIIIDEASMLTKNDVFTLAKNFPLSTFLFVGDKDQLPPIGDEDFSIFDVFERYTLTENHRCGIGNNIFDLIEAVRVRGAAVDYRDYVDGKNVVKIDEIDRFVNEEVPIIVYYNKTRQKWNHYVLGLRTGGKITTETKFISNESNKVMKNGQIFYPDQVTVKNWNLEKGVPLKYYELGIETRKGMKTVNYLDPENREILNMFLQPLVETKNWIKYFALKERYPDVDLGYCITSHKAQGSTFDTAIIDWSDIATSPQQTRKASLYVACSRVSNKLLII